jgi:hypothetical protein
MIGEPLHEILTLSQQRALHKAVTYLTEDLIDEIVRLGARGTINPDSWLGEHLPRQYAARYDHRFARKLLACVMTIAWKLWSPDHHRPACLGEELALEAIISTTEGVLSWRPGTDDLDMLREVVFEDTDFMFLFNPKYDGIQDDPTIQAVMPMSGMDFDDWFKPWHSRWYVHPMSHRPRMRKLKPPPDEDDPPDPEPAVDTAILPPVGTKLGAIGPLSSLPVDALWPISRFVEDLWAIPQVTRIGTSIGEQAVEVWVFLIEPSPEAEAQVTVAQGVFLATGAPLPIQVRVAAIAHVDPGNLPVFGAVLERESESPDRPDKTGSIDEDDADA